jgi:uncharacterized protein YlxW (UPF0749 family)
MHTRLFSRKYFLSLAIVVVIAFSWFGVLDEYSDNYTDASIIEAGTSYAIARGINGIVSVLQTSTVQVGAGISGSMAFGEVLDPINDLIERFSHVMSFALGSLVFQKILLEVSAHGVFKFLIAVFGIALIYAFLIKNNTVMSWASRIFAILIFVRFSLVIVVALNSITDNVFISKQIESGTDELRDFRADVTQLKENSTNLNIDRSTYEESIRNARSKIDDINTTIMPGIELELANAESQLAEANASLEKIQKRMDLIERWSPLSDNKEATKIKNIISTHEQQIEALQISIDAYREQESQLREEIVISEKRLAGEPIDLLDRIKSGYTSMSGLKESLSIDVIEENLTETVNNIFRLSVLFILKTILIPITFFLLFIKVVKGIWKSDLTRIFYIEEELSTD